MNEIYRFYKSLDLEPEASLEEVKKAYRDLVDVWHTDRFTDNQRLQKKANEKLSEINEAYEKITRYISQKDKIIREEPKESIYDEQSRRDDQDGKTNEGFPEVDLISLLGKEKESIEVKHFISRLDDSPVFYREFFDYEFMDSGIALYFSDLLEASKSNTSRDTRILIKIMLFSEGYGRADRIRELYILGKEVGGYRQYRGSIPGGLKFSDDRQTTRKKLGLPSKSGSLSDEWLFPKYSIWVKYDSDGRMEQISLNEAGPVKEKGKWWEELWKGLRGEKV